jgi:hypothetical protein
LAAEARAPLRSSVAPATAPAPAVVVARRAVGPAASPAVPSGTDRPAPPAALPTGRPGAAAAPPAVRPPASVQRDVPAPAAGGSRAAAPLGGGAPRGQASRRSTDGTAPVDASPVSGADRAGGSPSSPAPVIARAPVAPGARPELTLPVVSRLAADASASVAAPGPALGWTAGSGFGPVPAAVGPVVQRVVEVGEVAAEVEPGSGSGGAGAAAEGPGGPPDYEDIAEHVYDRIRSRIALELLLDRERMGLLIDG